MKEKREWWKWMLIALLVAMLALVTYDCMAQSPQAWRMFNKELILVTWSNGTDTRYSIREIYEKEVYKDIQYILREFNKMTDVLKDYPDALNAITNEYLNILWYEQKY